MKIQLAHPSDNDHFLDAPWTTPLALWTDPRTVDLSTGEHRHIVRFFRAGEGLYVIKELPDHLAEREFRLLRRLAGDAIPCVDVVGVVSERGGDAGSEGLLITRHLDFSLPYRLLVTDQRMPYLGEKLLDALVGLLVRLHLVGFFWGDCSLSNTLFRRDANALSAYVVDVETAEMHAQLSDGQRKADLWIAAENVAGGLADLQAAGKLPESFDPWTSVDHLERGYEGLWSELTGVEEIDPTDGRAVARRMRRLHELGFDVGEMELTTTDGGRRLRVVPRVVELEYHGPKLASLTGLRTGENQARRLLDDIAGHRLKWEAERGRAMPESLAAARWLDQIFEPAVAAIDPTLGDKLEPAELYVQISEHRWFLSENAGRDVGLDAAVASFASRVLRHVRDERTVIDSQAAIDANAEVSYGEVSHGDTVPE
jgi:Domain of unknown function (DUF4032)/Lipopolysaccharide kinase (Kdo/WaaP) family